MALIPHNYMPRSMFDMDVWHRPTLDAFDPFDDMDREMSRNLMWLNRPSFLDSMFSAPKVPQKWRITLDCQGYESNSIKTEIRDGKLFVSGCEGARSSKHDEDFECREFHKTYSLPANCETDKMVSFLTSNGQLVIEMPLREEEQQASQRSLLPQIVDADKHGHKRVEMKLNLPSHIDPAHVSITCKDRDVIIKAEEREDKPDHHSKVHYYQRTTMPAGTDFKSMECTYGKDHSLSICAPLADNAIKDKSHGVPIEYHGSHRKDSR